jgi:hypothetical protein
MLAMATDKFSVSYYENLLCFRMPTYKILALFKLIFEDTVQALLQIIYLLLAKKEDTNLIIIIISLCFAFPSILSSLFAIIYSTTSNLKDEDFEEMRESKRRNQTKFPFQKQFVYTYPYRHRK